MAPARRREHVSTVVSPERYGVAWEERLPFFFFLLFFSNALITSLPSLRYLDLSRYAILFFP